VLPANYLTEMLTDWGIISSTDPQWTNNSTLSFAFNIGPNGFFDKPAAWTSPRESPGAIQQAISKLIAAQNKLRKAIFFEILDKQNLDKAFLASQGQIAFEAANTAIGNFDLQLQQAINNANEGYATGSKIADVLVKGLDDAMVQIPEETPTTF